MKKITVGRDSGCDIVISDPDYVVSRVHAEIIPFCNQDNHNVFSVCAN
ncbi:MAG: FHA domain-containing protein, partial [Pelodictyon phaeoclathratiforme]|nr:FHA domain-containing protein [Pelodictyon phaeoclathratiforme]